MTSTSLVQLYFYNKLFFFIATGAGLHPSQKYDKDNWMIFTYSVAKGLLLYFMGVLKVSGYFKIPYVEKTYTLNSIYRQLLIPISVILEMHNMSNFLHAPDELKQQINFRL